MTVNWTITTLGEICSNQRGTIQTGPFGSQLHTSDYKEIGIPVVMPTNIGDGGIVEDGIARISQEDVNRLSQHILRIGDIVFSRRGDVTKNALIRSHEMGWFCGTGCLKVRLGDESLACAEFISHYLRLPKIKEWLIRHAVGATMPNLNTGILSAVPICLPSLKEQKWISKILGDLDSKIAINRQTNQTLERMAQTIFKSWFVDFDPTRAKIAAKEEWENKTPQAPENDPAKAIFIERAAMCAISGKSAAELDQLDDEVIAQLKATAALFPDSLVNSELGETPEGWEVGSLSDLIDFNPKRTLKKNQLSPYLDMQNVPTQGHLAENVVLREMGSGTKFINGDTLLARITPCLENGKTAFVDFLEEYQVGWGSTEYIVMRSKANLPASIAYFIARQDSFRKLAIQTMTGTSGRQRADAKAISELPYLLYPEPILLTFGKIADEFLRSSRARHDESKSLAQLRDSLLPKLLSGEIDLSETLSEVA